MPTDKKKQYKANYDDECKLHVQLVLKNLVIESIYLSIYLKSQDYGDITGGAQQGRLTMS